MPIAVGLARCGDEPRSDEEEVRATIEEFILDFERDLADLGPEEFCDTRILAGTHPPRDRREVEEQLKATEKECERFFAEDVPEIDPDEDDGREFTDLEISEVRVQGNSATARVTFRSDGKLNKEPLYELVEVEEGDWRVVVNEF